MKRSLAAAAILLFACSTASAEGILYCVDGVQGTDHMSVALQGFVGPHTVTETTVANCETELLTLPYGLVVLALQQDAHAGLVDYPWIQLFVDAGGRIIIQDRFKDAGVAALFAASYTAADDQTPVSITLAALQPGVTNPMALTNPGWPLMSMGLGTTTGTAAATFPNGDAAIVIANGGRTIVNGFLTDTATVGADAVALYTNEIDLLLNAPSWCMVDADCSDDDLCNGLEACLSNQCQSGTPLVCSDGDPCTDDQCDAAAGCRFPYNTDPCDDSDPCTLSDACDGAGTCLGVPKTSVPEASGGCDDGNVCTSDTCDPSDGACGHAPATGACDDGLWCTVNDVCTAGSCAGSARDCSAVSDDCKVGTCDESLGACVPQPVADGTACDDGLYCSVNDACAAGLCGGEARDCSAFDDACNLGSCDEVASACEALPRANGTPCQDGLYCTDNDTCAGGSCTAGSPRDCSSATNACNTGTCDEGLGQCVGIPVADGALCDDGQFCTLNDNCVAGVCTGGPRDCSVVSDDCNAGVCNETGDTCDPQPLADGTACDDGRVCTQGDSCTAGVCAGPLRDCSAVADLCNAGVCNEATGACEPQPFPDGTACDDGLFCAVPDSCVSGACTAGPARDCSAAADDCNDAVCNEAAGTCDPVPLADGLPCDDGLTCTISDICTAGACTGTARDCSWMSDPCNDGVCTEPGGVCGLAPVTDGTACDDGLFCTDPDACTSGVCGGGPRDCSGVADNCNAGVCNELNTRCDAVPFADGTACEDGQFCTTGEVCVGGACLGGGPRDCSGVADTCNDAACNESAGACEPLPLADGTACDDGLYCTVSETCSAGTCLGPARDCSAIADACSLGVCNETLPACEAQPVPDGTACDDADPCTMTDVCNGSVCAGEPLDADGDGHTAESCSGGDCDDFDASIHPGASEVCEDGIDQDCNGMDITCACPDADADGFESTACGGTDCDDADDAVHPDADEVCDDTVDNDCDDETDNDDVDCRGCDADGDLFEAIACGGTDCDDDDASIHPGGGEVCDDSLDNDCDLLIDDEDADCDCLDADGDSYLDHVCGGDDCNDGDATVHPTAEEVCGDGIDQDCDRDDPACPCPDADEDGFADAACGGDDCDDADPEVHPDADEVCDDGTDNDCDGLSDIDDEECDCPDSDGDGYTDAACGGDDCEDKFFSIHPLADEVCDDRVDNDCDGLVDEQDAVDCPSSGSSGCGCGAQAAGGWLWVLVLMAVFRRRR